MTKRNAGGKSKSQIARGTKELSFTEWASPFMVTTNADLDLTESLDEESLEWPQFKVQAVPASSPIKSKRKRS